MDSITLENLGYNENLVRYRNEQKLDFLDIGRVTAQHKDRYTVKSETTELEAELMGNLRFTAENQYDIPAVGDWVAISTYDDHKALIHAIYPRHSLIERKASGGPSKTQIIAANIHYGFVVQAVNRDFNLNRLERYITICYASKVRPIILLTKIDLIDQTTLDSLLEQVNERLKEVPIISLSIVSEVGLAELTDILEKGKTYCLLGSSGVGKSTLVNKLTNGQVMNTGAISKTIDRGKHITTHRELVLLENGGILIDNPGMREVGLTDRTAGLEMTFDQILERTQQCRFNDCTHTNEKGCALLLAMESGEIDERAYANFKKMEKERAHFESSVEERRKKDKNFGKMVRSIKKERKQRKY